jgi:hypothetical protein
MMDATNPTKVSTHTPDPLGLKPVIDSNPDVTKVALSSLARLEESTPPLSSREITSASTTSISELSIEHLDLDKLALPTGLGYGYKAANLMQLEILALKVAAEVPRFKAIRHEEVLSYILIHYPRFLGDYAIFRSLLGNPPNLTEEAKGMLLSMRSQIEEIFTNKEGKSLFGLDPFIKSVGSDFLIVRSTGKEDSDTNSNAGGNLSIPYTRKDEREVLSHIGKVLSSYFSDKSISQRITSRDPSLVEDEIPFVPVLIQQMCGEPLSDTDIMKEL